MMSSRSSNAIWNDVGWLKQTTATTRAHPTGHQRGGGNKAGWLPPL
jgi:hypothetical protein